MNGLRERFEEWAESEGYPISRGFGKDNNYDFVETRRMWQTWQVRELQSLGWSLLYRFPKSNPEKENVAYVYKLKSPRGTHVAYVDTDCTEHYIQG